MSEALPAPLSRLLSQRLDALSPQLARASLRPDALERFLVASDFGYGVLLQQADAIEKIAGPMPANPTLDPAAPAAWPAQLRRWRALASTRLIWRDIAGLTGA